MDEVKKFKTLDEIDARIAQYKRHVQAVPPLDGKKLTQVIVENWTELIPLIFLHRVPQSDNLAYEVRRTDHYQDPKGESYLLYSNAHQYRIDEENLHFLMSYTMNYGRYKEEIMSIGFQLGLFFDEEFQFGIDAFVSFPDKLTHQLKFSTMHHSVDDLQAFGTKLSEMLQ